jgi:hypothetical protein
MRNVYAIFIFAIFFLGATPAFANTEMHFGYKQGSLDGPNGLTLLKNQFASLLMSEAFNQIDQTLLEWNTPSQRMDDGHWKLSTFMGGIDNELTMTNNWDGNYQLIEHWRQQNPKSSGLALTEAAYWYYYAWDARGNGWAKNVTPEGNQLFTERLHKAEDILRASKDYASDNPVWYELSMEVANSLNQDKNKIYDLFKEAVSKQKLYYSNYAAMMMTLEPRWGGSWTLVDKFINDSWQKTKELEGNTLYTRLYSMEDKSENINNLFKQTSASWTIMKKGFEDILKNYPSSKWELNNFASFACRAGDKQTYQSERLKIGNEIIPEAWRSNYSIDLCDHTYLTPL